VAVGGNAEHEDETREITMAGRSWMLVAGCVVGLAACSPTPAPPAGQQGSTATQNLLLAAASVALPSGISAVELPDPQSKGAELVAKYCGQGCHGIPAPASHAQSDWPVVLRRMWLRMGKIDTTFHVAVPDDAERTVMLEYFLAYAFQVTSGNLPDAPGKERFTATCSQCHALPDPKQHSAQDWVAVVRRMNVHMEKMLRTVLSQDEMQRIVLYLGRASGS
jgi:cytochrome c5